MKARLIGRHLTDRYGSINHTGSLCYTLTFVFVLSVDNFIEYEKK